MNRVCLASLTPKGDGHMTDLTLGELEKMQEKLQSRDNGPGSVAMVRRRRSASGASSALQPRAGMWLKLTDDPDRRGEFVRAGQGYDGKVYWLVKDGRNTFYYYAMERWMAEENHEH